MSQFKQSIDMSNNEELKALYQALYRQILNTWTDIPDVLSHQAH